MGTPAPEPPVTSRAGSPADRPLPPALRRHGHLGRGPIGREPISTELLKEHQRERVMAAAVEIFGLRGYQATTVDDLLAAARVGYGNFYGFFDGKEDCLLAAFDWATARARRAAEDAAAGESEWAERTYIGLGGIVSMLAGNPLMARFVLIEAQAGGEAARARHADLLGEVGAWLACGREHGSLDPGANYETTAVGGLLFYLQHCALHPEPLDPAQVLDGAAPLLLEPVIGADGVAALRRAVHAGTS